MPKKLLLIVLDGVGAGALPDAATYHDEGAATLAHAYEKTGVPLPNLCALGLGNIPGTGFPPMAAPQASYGRMAEASHAKDTTAGHWEIAGLITEQPFPTFPEGFPQTFIHSFERAIGRGTLGNYASSGTAILDELGEAHMKTGKIIVYTSADSVFQIAAHEDLIPPPELYRICKTARAMLAGPLAVGRVIARPFEGVPGHFARTINRRDFSLAPPGDTLLDVLCANGYETMGVGKIEDIFAHRGLTQSNHVAGNDACVEAMLEYGKQDKSGLIFVNLVDFDSLYGHRRDVQGMAEALKRFDDQLPSILDALGPDDLLVLTADHGNDPTHHGTDHTREYVPLLCYGKNRVAKDLGTRATFADLSATALAFFGLENPLAGKSFL